ncbi:MAG: hypothetical protein HUK24_01945 [Sphaerochaetaceae bacterium]|nr:hypothetical protein [Sphaerochaetaceae bacterium]
MRQMNFGNYNRNNNNNNNNNYDRGFEFNGRRYNADTQNISAEDICDITGTKKGRKIVVQTSDGMRTLERGRRYSIPPMAKFKDAPDVRKAATYSESSYTYGKVRRPDWCNEIIRDQILDIEEKLFHGSPALVDNPENPVKIAFTGFRLPNSVCSQNNGITSCPIVLMIPDQYPEMPPVGFYLPAEIKAGKHSGYGRAYHGGSDKPVTFDGKEYRWYCSSIVAETWSPAQIQRINDWKKGDNLWQVVTLISEVLSDLSDD